MRLSPVLGSLLLGLTAVPLALPATVHAQDGFLFDQPRVTLSVRGGHHFANAGSDVYDFFIEQLTLERSDFSGTTFMGELGVRVLPSVDLVASVGRISSTARSESRTHEATEGPPIAQTTTLRRTPVTATVKYYPLSRGHSIGSNAWIPARLTPYVGIGGGALKYSLEQSGEFVDYQTCDDQNVCEIFPATFQSDGWARSLHVTGGADYWLTTRLGLSAELRYQWASAPLGPSFLGGFDDIDLRGFQGTVGLSLRF